MSRRLRFKKRHSLAVETACKQLSLTTPQAVQKPKGRRKETIIELQVSAEHARWLLLALPSDVKPIDGW